MRAYRSTFEGTQYRSIPATPRLPKVPGLGMAAGVVINLGLWGLIAVLATVLAN